VELSHYIPGRPTDPPPLLGRYHPPIPANVARAYIETYSQPGDLILDPFAHGAGVIREAIASGRRILAANANPIVLLDTPGSLTLPAPDELDALTTRLGDSPKMSQTIRRHIDDLYRTRCPHCARTVIADYFVWERDSAGPVEKVYHCPGCGDERHEPVDQADRVRLATIEARDFQYYYLLERLAGPYDEHRPQAQKLLDLYTPRNLYALANLTMKVETMFSDAEDRRALYVILLGCLDACSKLNASPWDSTHPGRLRPPGRFVELNVWRAFEAVRQRLRQHAATPLTMAGSLEEVVGTTAAMKARGLALVLSQGARNLATRLVPASARLVLAALPPLDSVFYGLSFLWTGWLFGRKAAARLEPLLKRRGHDWSWYEKALGRTLTALRPSLCADSRLVLIGRSHNPSYVEALLMAASRAALSASSIVYQPASEHSSSDLFQGQGGEYRVTLSLHRPVREARPTDPQVLADVIQREALTAAKEVLRARSEPLTLDWLHIAAWQRLSQKGLLDQTTLVSDEGFHPLEFTREQVRLAFERGLEASLTGLGREEGQADHWWLAAPGTGLDPLSDRVERVVLERLTEEVWVTEEMAYHAFPGLLTPVRDLVEACLRAYGAERSPGVWQLRQGETQETWDRVSREMVGHLVDLGRRLDYRVLVASRWDGMAWPAASTLSPRAGVSIPSWLDVLWLDGSRPLHAFALRHVAFLGFLLSDDPFGGRSDPIWSRSAAGLCRYVVLPEERAELARLKLSSSPLLRQAMVRQGWDFIKFQHLRRLAGAGSLERHHLRVILGLDPIIEQTEAQIPLF